MIATRIIRILCYDIRIPHVERQARMKQKLTITVDADLVPRAKRYAKSKGVSLSSLVEQSLREMAGEYSTTFSSRWRGRFQAAGREDDPLYDRLAEKYLS